MRVYRTLQWGYFVCDATPGAMTSELRMVDRVNVVGSLSDSCARFRTEAGRPGVQSA